MPSQFSTIFQPTTSTNMLICPQCEFENPEANKFCQNCGSSLTHKACHDCGTEVLFNAATCHNCGTFTGTVWWAIAQGTSPITTPATSSETTTPVYLDRQQRYQIIESQPWQGGANAVWQGRVLDAYPLQKVNDQNLQLPSLAEPYLHLRSSFIQTLPLIHDSWETEGQSYLLLEDRSQWQLLSDIWGSPEISLSQVLYWLEEIALLWEALIPWQQCQSLLEVGNLHLDEDQAISLQCLYPDPKPDTEAAPLQLSLVDLGKALLSLSPPSPLININQLLEELAAGEIVSIVALQNRLAILNQESAFSESIGETVENEDFDDFDDFDELEEEEIEEITVEDDLFFPESDTFIQADKTRVSINYNSDRSDDAPTVVLPMQLLSLDDAGYTDIGQQRDHNEDNFGIQVKIEKQEHPLGKNLKARGLYILCDGMGGHAAGEVASSLAVDTLKRYFSEKWQEQMPNSGVIKEGIISANQVLYDINQQKSSSGSGRMGTTLSMMLLQDNNVAIAHVGDSRVYRVTRKGGLEQLTTDHEVGQREIKRGVEPEIAYSRPDAYQLTQALGPRDMDFIKPDVRLIDINEDTLFVLCSDGLSDNDLLEKNWESYLTPLLSSRANLSQGVNRLIEFANEHNGHDNITVLLVRVKVQPVFEQQQMF